MHNALARGLVVRLCTFHGLVFLAREESAATIDLVEFFREELEELVSVLLLVTGELLVGLPLREPEAGQDIGRGIASCVLLSVEVLKHVVHGTTHAVLNCAVRVLVSIPEVEISQEGIMHEALEDHVHVTGGPHVIDASQATGPTRCLGRVCRDESRVLFGGLGEELVMLPFSG